MRRSLPVLLIMLAPMLSAVPAAAQPADTATVTLVHGFRGLLADVYVDGDRILEGFAPERSTDPTELPAGEHLVEVREADAAADSEPVVEGTLDVPAGANLSAVVHATGDGDPTISVFDNTFDSPGADRARTVVRHTAQAAPITVTVGDVEVAATLEPGAQAAAMVDPRADAVTVVDASTSEQLLAPSEITIGHDTTVALYLIGAAGDGSLGWLTERLDTAARVPGRVPTGNSGLAAETSTPWWAVAAGALAAMALLRLVRRAGRARPGEAA
jgi:hypothetical protein